MLKDKNLLILIGIGILLMFMNGEKESTYECTGPNGFYGDWYCVGNKGYVCDVNEISGGHSWHHSSDCDFCIPDTEMGPYEAVCGQGQEGMPDCINHCYYMYPYADVVRYNKRGDEMGIALDCSNWMYDLKPYFTSESYTSAQTQENLAVNFCEQTGCECSNNGEGDDACCDGCHFIGIGDVPTDCISQCYRMNTECTKYLGETWDICDGTSAACPTGLCSPTYKSTTTLCGNGGHCDGSGNCIDETQPTCTSGTCCDGSTYRPNTYQCDVFDCNIYDTVCKTYVDQPVYCTGGSTECPSDNVCPVFTLIDEGTPCDTNKMCNADGACVDVDCDALKQIALNKILDWQINPTQSNKNIALGAIVDWSNNC